MRGRKILLAGLTASLTLVATPALACGGLIAPNGSVSLVRTTTLAAYHEGVEHYVTSFEFAGGGEGEFGSIVPLPGVPTDVVRGGDWTLQRLVQETQPQPEFLAATAAFAEDSAGARVLLKTEIDALDVVILEGGGTDVGNWARKHGFLLPPDAPEVLDFYARRSPVFMAIRYDAERAAAQGLDTGDGTPVHVAIPTTNPWVPLRILGLGAGAEAPVEADVYLLTDREPALLPAPTGPRSGVEGLVLERSELATDTLLADLRSDKGMRWMPASGMWLTYMRVDEQAGDLTYDLAVDASGVGQPSPVAAGLTPVERDLGDAAASRIPLVPLAVILVMTAATAIVVVATRRRSPVRVK